jgi:ATP-dependent RNA helicase DHX37/DHR1
MEMKQNFDGSMIGTKTGSPFDKFNIKSTKLVFVLDRILLNEMSEDKTLKNYKAIIIDEAHERNINSDILIGLIF